MILDFVGKGEFARLDMDRKKKKVVITSSKTNYIPTETEWKNLFDAGKEEEQEKLTDPLTDGDFKAVMIAGMNKLNYTFKEEIKIIERKR